jgi:hypothetical protein
MIHEPSNPEPDVDPQGLWQSQKKEYDPMTLADIHQKARRFESKVQGRNAREYVACGIVIIGFAYTLMTGPHWLMRVGAGLIILAVPYVAWQLHRRGSAEGLPEPGETLVDAYRRHLSRQRDALRSVGSWYLAPIAPGLALLMVGMWFAPLKPGVPLERKQASLLIMAALMVAVFFGVWLLNRWGAKRLQKRIDDL